MRPRRRRRLPPVVDAEWLRDRLGRVVVCDVRWYLDGRSGKAAYDEGHLPGAVFADLDADLAAPPGGTRGRHPLPDPEAFADAMSRLGIGDRDTVVAYDDDGGSIAARLVWLLRVIRRDAAILDGGLDAWEGDLSTDPVHRPRAHFTATPWPSDRLADADLTARLAQSEHTAVIDARAPDRYTGEREPVDPRPGHIPGAVNVPYADNFLPDTRFLRRADSLRVIYAGAGATGGRDIVVYCGSGVTACLDLLALEYAGIDDARLYADSWSGWSADPERPAEPAEPADASDNPET